MSENVQIENSRNVNFCLNGHNLPDIKQKTETQTQKQNFLHTPIPPVRWCSHTRCPLKTRKKSKYP